MRRVECHSRYKVMDDRKVLSISVWRGEYPNRECKGVDIIDDRENPRFVDGCLRPAIDTLNRTLWPDVAPVTLDEVVFDG